VTHLTLRLLVKRTPDALLVVSICNWCSMRNCKYEDHMKYLHPFALQDTVKGSRLISVEDGPKPSDEPAYRAATEKVVDVEADTGA
jgi:hypothetical protein